MHQLYSSEVYSCSLAFGKYATRLEIDRELLECIPSSFAAYVVNGLIDSVVTLKVKVFDDDVTHTPVQGWVYATTENKHVVSYSDAGKMLFSLAYDTRLNMIVIDVRRNDVRSVSLGIQHAMLLALSSHCIGLHGVTLICKNQLIILSAPSGTGKTTLSKLLSKYCEAAVINGDFALLSVSDDNVFFEPTPFCGTSKRCLNYRLPLERIVFLSQSPNNCLQAIDTRTALKSLLSNTFVPIWDTKLGEAVHSTAFSIANKLSFYSFAFAPNEKAATMLHNSIACET